MNIWKLLNEMECLQKDVSKTSDECGFFGRPKFSFLKNLAGFSFPEVNVADDKEQFTVEALIPGVEPSSLNLSIVGNVLTISGEKPELRTSGEEATHRQERTAGKFSRAIELPAGVDSSKVNAEYRHGVLKITIAKTPEAQPRKIDIPVNS